jgi:uncharacterized protein
VRLTGKTVLITGASRGIGAATARAFAQQGARVLLLARTELALAQVAQDITAQGGQASVYPIDLASSGAIERTTQTITTEVGIPDIIINNAGSGSWRFAEETSAAEVVDMMAVPYFAAFQITRAFLPQMLMRRSGHILNVTSVVAYRAIPGATAYSAACWAMRGFTEALRADLHRTGLHVTLLAAGTTTTPGFQHYPGVEERMPRITRVVPIVTPEQVAEAILWGIERERRTIVIPFAMHLLVVLNSVAPRLVEWLVVRSGWQHAKPAER